MVWWRRWTWVTVPGLTALDLTAERGGAGITS